MPRSATDHLEKLADPWDHSPLALREDGGEAFLVSETGRTYSLGAGAICLMPTSDEVSRYFGMRNYQSWRSLQDEAEKSYAVRVEGHFSVDSYKPAVEFGEMLAEFSLVECLDVGCGALPLPTYMKPAANTRFFGIDPMDLPTSREFPFVRAYGDFLPFRNASFDGVVFPSSLDHCLNPLKALEEASRVLKPGGMLCVWETIRPADQNFAAWTLRSSYFLSRYNKLHNWGFTRDTLEFVIREAGFSDFTWRQTSAATESIIITRKR